MADYRISFRIVNDSADSYDRGYAALEAAIEDCTTFGMWKTDTSFVAIRSTYSIEAVGGHLKKAINPAIDHVVIRQIDYKNTAYVGSPGTNFEAFFPDAKKL